MAEVVDTVWGKSVFHFYNIRHCKEGLFLCSIIINDPGSEILDDEQEAEKENMIVAYVKSQNRGPSNAS